MVYLLMVHIYTGPDAIRKENPLPPNRLAIVNTNKGNDKLS